MEKIKEDAKVKYILDESLKEPLLTKVYSVQDGVELESNDCFISLNEVEAQAMFDFLDDWLAMKRIEQREEDKEICHECGFQCCQCPREPEYNHEDKLGE